MLTLYLKIHNKTNLKYLGYTKQDPFKYKGSGVYWSRHLKEHGNDVTTEILFQSESIDEIGSKGLEFSKLWDITNSSDFANLCDEDGNKNYGTANPNFIGHPQSEETKRKISENHSRYWAGKNGTLHHATGKKRPDSVNIARKMGKANLGKTPWNKGKKIGSHTEESNKKRSESMKNVKWKIHECPHCGKIGKSNAMKRWHFDNCRSK